MQERSIANSSPRNSHQKSNTTQALVNETVVEVRFTSTLTSSEINTLWDRVKTSYLDSKRTLTKATLTSGAVRDFEGNLFAGRSDEDPILLITIVNDTQTPNLEHFSVSLNDLVQPEDYMNTASGVRLFLAPNTSSIVQTAVLHYLSGAIAETALSAFAVLALSNATLSYNPSLYLLASTPPLPPPSRRREQSPTSSSATERGSSPSITSTPRPVS